MSAATVETTVPAYRVCHRCVMDSSADGFSIVGPEGCTYCVPYSAPGVRRHRPDADLRGLVDRIKREGHGLPYDCIVGVSGGIDSSWCLLKAKELGLRPLAVHMDNGWNSELAQNNIEVVVKAAGADLITHVIEWDEYRDLMAAFLAAHVIDIELLYDNAMLAVNFEQSRRFGIRTILAGTNNATEGMLMPASWNWHKWDARNIRDIWRVHQGGPFPRSFPIASTWSLVRSRVKGRPVWEPFPDYLPYSRSAAIRDLEAVGFKPYPYKHYESVFTRFYQAVILPRKFGVDKRRHHLSMLVLNGEIGRSEALAQLAESPYPNARDERRDTRYFLKKMMWSEQQLSDYLAAPPRAHSRYRNEQRLFEVTRSMSRLVRR